MAQSDPRPQEPSSSCVSEPKHPWWRRVFGRENGMASQPEGPAAQQDMTDDASKPGLIRRVSRKVVPGLPRAQTFKRQQSEVRNKLEPIQTSTSERRTVSVDRRLQRARTISQTRSDARASAPDFLDKAYSEAASLPSLAASPLNEKVASPLALADIDLLSAEPRHDDRLPDAASLLDTRSVTTSQYDNLIHDELEKTWILNLSMHFRDKSKREKFFVTFRKTETLWRRVTISLDYRNAPENSLEMDLAQTKFQREKSAKIYEAIRESLGDIQFYDTVTNLKLQTTDGRLHVHVVEDVNEIIQYPTTHMIQHLGCRRIKEQDIVFHSHMSGFVYKVQVDRDMLIKKEIPGPDTVDEFLYEVNALNALQGSKNVIKFHGVIVDNQDECVKGLLISYAEQGALIDMLYDNPHSIPWPVRERWARQIVQGLSDIHEAGFVQGDFTLSNIVIDDNGNAKIIDINRRGCPVGWEPPEATPLIESNQRISMYIGVKSDLYQLGMVLWALAAQEDEPEALGRPLQLGPDIKVPLYYRRVVGTCLSSNPRDRLQAMSLLAMFPKQATAAKYNDQRDAPSISVEDGYSIQEYMVDGYNVRPVVQTLQPSNDSSYTSTGHPHMDAGSGWCSDPYYFPTRGRSPPSPMPSNHEYCDSPRRPFSWSDRDHSAPSLSLSSRNELETESEVEPAAVQAPRTKAKHNLILGMGLPVNATTAAPVPNANEDSQQMPTAIVGGPPSLGVESPGLATPTITVEVADRLPAVNSTGALERSVSMDTDKDGGTVDFEKGAIVETNSIVPTRGTGSVLPEGITEPGDPSNSRPSPGVPSPISRPQAAQLPAPELPPTQRGGVVHNVATTMSTHTERRDASSIGEGTTEGSGSSERQEMVDDLKGIGGAYADAGSHLFNGRDGHGWMDDDINLLTTEPQR